MMKMNKTLIILSLLLIFCISLGAVSATDNTDMSINDIDNNIATVESSVNVDEINVNSGEINKSSEIYNDIKNATGTYNILADYQIDQTWRINNSNVIIEGNNHTIYGNGNQAFYITGKNVTIKNLNFINCPNNSKGGAISFDGSGSVSGCSFVNCSAGVGGAIYFNRIGGSVSGCSFVNCYAGVAGAIFFEGNGSVSGCSFVGCSAAIGGGAISFNRIGGSVSGCSFVNCNVTIGGGAISFNPDGGSVSGCSFVNCSAGVGGAIYFESGGSVSGCSFVNCTASEGGAIYFKGGSSVNYCVFDNNKANEGSAIYISSGSVDVDFNFFGFQNNIAEFPNGLVEGASPNNWVVLDVTNSGDSYLVNFITNDYNTLDNNMPDYTARLSINGATKDVLIKNNIYSDTFVPGNYVLTSLNSGNILANKTFNVPDTPGTDDIDNDSDKDNCNKVNTAVGNMENCGTPLLALLIALITLPIIRRK